MSGQTRLHAAATLMLEIERAMRAAGFWHTRIPTPAAMASRTPFCADTLALSEWLQFIFLPRMHELIEQDAGLPNASGIAAIAEEALDECAGKAAVVERLRAFDRLIETS